MEKVISEKRAHRRYPLQLPVRYSVLQGHAFAVSGAGLTENLSSGGVAFASNTAMDIGSAIDVWVSWPVCGQETSTLELRMTGRVVRSSGAETAVQVKRCDFVSTERTRNEGAGAGSTEAGVPATRLPGTPEPRRVCRWRSCS
jgi:hypothetical protein